MTFMALEVEHKWLKYFYTFLSGAEQSVALSVADIMFWFWIKIPPLMTSLLVITYISCSLSHLTHVALWSH